MQLFSTVLTNGSFLLSIYRFHFCVYNQFCVYKLCFGVFPCFMKTFPEMTWQSVEVQALFFILSSKDVKENGKSEEFV